MSYSVGVKYEDSAGEMYGIWDWRKNAWTPIESRDYEKIARQVRNMNKKRKDDERL